MSTAVVDPTASATARGPRRRTGIPLSRLIAVELRKMFDTRSGFWLMASIVITAVLATGAVILFAPDERAHLRPRSPRRSASRWRSSCR